MAEARSMATTDAYLTGHHLSVEYISATKGLMRPRMLKGENTLEVVVNLFGVVSGFLKSKIRSAKRALLNALFPSTPLSWYTTIGCVGGVRYLMPELGLKVDQHIPLINRISDERLQKVVSIVSFGTVLFFAGIFTARVSLKILLRYRGFLYDSPKKPSFVTLSWLSLVRLLEGFGTPMTYSFQGVLPNLPVPSLKDTCRRYLESAKPLLDDAEYDRMERLAADFQAEEGFWLQLALVVKSWLVPNYVTDWWEAFVYLCSRESIMINSNYYIMDAYQWTPTSNQVARAANIVFQIAKYKKKLENEELPPLMVNNTIPLCMSQYERSFGTTRIPQHGQDVIQHVPKPKHVAVLCKGHYFIFNLLGDKGESLTALHYEKQLEKIVKMAEEADEASFTEQNLAAMTASNRDKWATFRDEFMSEGVTRASLEAVERAAFFLVLDDAAPIEREGVSKPNEVGQQLLHGNGSNRWFDKSFTVVVFSNGKVGFNCEHAWADAPVAAQILETALATEFAGVGYDSTTGKNKAVPYPKVKMHEPMKLRWKFSPKAEDVLREVVEENQEAIKDLDLRILRYTAYSKGFIKKCKTSPDAWMQMALQIAFFRDRGHFAQTYEASMTRLYRDGRTETVRPVTSTSAAFVRAMCDEEKEWSREELRAMFKKATNIHVHNFKDAMAGKGIDRHLFCLLVASKSLKKDSPFLNEVLSAPWVLSTSQTPVQQTGLFDLKNNLNKCTGGGGFGPVADDGYGVSYIVSSDMEVSFHITSKVSSDKTDSERFAHNIERAMQDIKALFVEDEDEQ
eukprot:m.63748 g.63748  ORF g.63748 m.63748 type:complete len:794 (-) comp11459_c0_seq2:126-2507(-)